MGVANNGVNPRDPTPTAAVAIAEFPEITFDVTDHGVQFCAALCCPLTCSACIPGVLGPKILVLEPEEVYFHNEFLCLKVDRRLPYGELGTVDTSTCGCCTGFNSTGLGAFFPGWGCEGELNANVVKELKLRMKERGDTGQIRRTEELQERIHNVEQIVLQNSAQLKAIAEHLHAPVIETMSRS